MISAFENRASPDSQVDELPQSGSTVGSVHPDVPPMAWAASTEVEAQPTEGKRGPGRSDSGH